MSKPYKSKEQALAVFEELGYVSEFAPRRIYNAADRKKKTEVDARNARRKRAAVTLGYILRNSGGYLKWAPREDP